MEEMSAVIKQNTENSRTTESISTGAARMAEESSKVMLETIESMKRITEKISVIEEIARQTNLLALNAAIEAARAGQYGQGFAVVAGEVRKLAENSKQAAVEIGELSLKVRNQAETSGTQLTELVPEIRKTADLVQEISAASIEQDRGSQQINQALMQLDQVIQQNASSSEELTSTSESLANQAASLSNAMLFFKINQENPTRLLPQEPE